MNELELLKREEGSQMRSIYMGRDFDIELLRLRWRGLSLRKKRQIITGVLLFLVGIGYVLAGPSGSTLTQRQYAFYNDDGADVNSNTVRTNSATSTAITGVRRGERMNVRIQLDNSGTGAATTTYRLQFENNTDSPGTWNDLGTTTQVRTSLSDRAAIAGRWGSPPLPTIQVTPTCSSSYSYTPGRFIVAGGTSTPLSLNPSSCTELTYAIETSGVLLGKTYRLRLVTGSTTAALDNYAVYPTFSTVSSIVDILEVSKEARGGTTTSMLEGTNDVGYTPSLAIGIDGNPLVAHHDFTTDDLRLLRCTNSTCTATSGSMLEGVGGVGDNSIMNIGVDGNPFIVHNDFSGDIRLLRCTNSTCTATSGSLLSAGFLNPAPSPTIGADGNLLIAHYDEDFVGIRVLRCTNSTCTATSSSLIGGINGSGFSFDIAINTAGNPMVVYGGQSPFDLGLVRCTNSTCTATSGSMLEGTSDVGLGPSLVIGTDGNPLVSHYNSSSGDLRLLLCTDSNCTATSGSALETTNDVGNSPSLAIGVDGNPMIAHRDETNANLRLLLCSNSACSTRSGVMLEGANDVGNFPSLAIGVDGNPMIAHLESAGDFTGDLRFLKCNSTDCSSTSTNANMNSSTTLSKLLDNTQ